jgi:phage shock protein PspC (stress-responsive transcriptional regulator)
VASAFLERLPRETGSLVSHVSHGGELAEAYRGISAEVAPQYTIGYVPTALPVPGARHPVRVTVEKKGVTVRPSHRLLHPGSPLGKAGRGDRSGLAERNRPPAASVGVGGEASVRAPSGPSRERRPLRRSRRHRIVAGVCGGLAEWLGWRPLLVRVIFVLVGALPLLSGILVYAALWLLIPEESG